MAGAAFTSSQGDPGLRFPDNRIKRLSYAWTADDTTPTTQTVVLPKINGQLLKLVTDPGSTAPTTLYDVTLIDQHGFDQLQGVGANRSATATEEVPIVYSGTANHPYVTEQDTLTLTVENNAVVSATGVIEITYLAIPV